MAPRPGLAAPRKAAVPVHPCLSWVCSSLAAEVQNTSICYDVHRGLLAFLGTGRKQRPPSPRDRVSCPLPSVQGEQEHPGRFLPNFCPDSLLPAGTSRGASAKALQQDTCSLQETLTRVPQTEELLVRGCVVGGRGRAICHCFLINAGFDMIIKSDFCINFLLIIYKNVLGNSHHVVQKHCPAGGLISALGHGDKAAMEQVPPGPPPTPAGNFWGAPHPAVLCCGVTAGSGGWQRLSYIPADLVPGAGGRRTHGAPRPFVRVQEGPGVHSGSAPGSLGLGARRGTAEMAHLHQK